MIKAILIDAKNRKVEKIEIEDSLDAYYKVLDCNMVEAAYFRDREITDVCYVDEEGTFGAENFFYHPAFYQPLAGNGLIVGTGSRGNTIDAQTFDTFDASLVEFFDIAEMQVAFVMGRFQNC